MMDKLHYFLKTFKNLEWSGPAWYSHEKDENGFPEKITLEYWYPLDLGTSGNTDWDGKDLIKLYPKLRKEFPEIGKSWVQGNVHSHHSMGAFFSGTDEQQLIDGANENFYYSLVVSTKPGKELFFGVSYPDQFGQVHIVEIDDIETDSVTEVMPEWKKEAKWIKKNKKPETTTLFKYNNRGSNHQATLFGDIKGEAQQHDEAVDVNDRYDEYLDFNSYNAIGTEMDFDVFQEFDKIMLDFDRGRINKKKLNQKLKKLGVDEYGRQVS